MIHHQLRIYVVSNGFRVIVGYSDDPVYEYVANTTQELGLILTQLIKEKKYEKKNCGSLAG